ncbi:MAG: hypothetical protein K2Q14_07500 [Gammaproteobacteria bacterium]|nr:hypothetical protein [Gammaproteobacteria bacterium]
MPPKDSHPATGNLLKSAPFSSYQALTRYYHQTRRLCEHDDARQEAFNRLHRFIQRLPSHINAETTEVQGLAELIRCDDSVDVRRGYSLKSHLVY